MREYEASERVAGRREDAETINLVNAQVNIILEDKLKTSD